jgi:hypothetical protein
MNTISRPRPHSPRSRQRGLSTLLIAILLLAIVTIITIFAARFGVFEQRMSANDYRYKMAFQASEAGLNQSMEYIRMSTAAMLSTAGEGWLAAGDPRWQPCTDDLPDGMALDPCLAEPDETRRNEMYRYVGNADSEQDGILPVADLMPELGLTVDGEAADDVAEFAAGYTSYATLCRIDISVEDSPRCALNPVTEDTFYVTIVSEGTLPNENATAVVKQSFGTFRTIGSAPDAPLIAAGAVVGLGNAEIVPNPNPGNTNNPLSVWSKEGVDIDDGSGGVGSFASCHLEEWLSTGTPESYTDGVCSDCTCSKLEFGYGMISGHNGGDKYEGEDILDVDGHASEATPQMRDSKYFPPDLFQYVFAVPSVDTTQDDEFLEETATVVTSCDSASFPTGGLYWYKGPGDCELESAGSIDDPVVLVSDVKVAATGKPTFFGIIYVRSCAGAGAELLKMNGGQVYGSVMLEGSGKMGGSPSLIYNKAVLQALRNSPNFLRYGPVPGSWSDTLQ